MKSHTLKPLILAMSLVSSPAFALDIVDELAQGYEDTTSINQSMSRARVNLNEIQRAWGKSDPMANVLVVQHNKSVTHKLRLREMMNTLLVLPAGEKIEAVSLGDKANFVFEPVRNDQGTVFENMGNVRAIYPGADTNLTIVTAEKNIYSFYLRVDTVESPYMPDLIVYVESQEIENAIKVKQLAAEEKKEQEARAKLEAEKLVSKTEKAKAEYLKTREDTNAAKLNFNYKQTAGDAALMPLRIMDDGLWTYFQYDEENLNKIQNLPAIYRVVDGVDTPVNSRIEGGTVVVETLSDKWTLRSGSTTACVGKDS